MLAWLHSSWYDRSRSGPSPTAGPKGQRSIEGGPTGMAILGLGADHLLKDKGSRSCRPESREGGQLSRGVSTGSTGPSQSPAMSGRRESAGMSGNLVQHITRHVMGHVQRHAVEEIAPPLLQSLAHGYGIADD